MSIKGIDVSYAQGKVNWLKVAPNIGFCIVRGGYGQNSIDTQAETNLKMLNEFAVPTGMYWFSYAKTPDYAEREADYACDLADKHKLWLPIFYDFEGASKRYLEKNNVPVTKELVRQNAIRFCERTKSRGYSAGIYLNKNYLENFYGTDFFTKHPEYYCWFAKLNYLGDYAEYPYIWQYSSTGVIDGISGNVDLNVLRVNYIKNFGKEK